MWPVMKLESTAVGDATGLDRINDKYERFPKAGMQRGSRDTNQPRVFPPPNTTFISYKSRRTPQLPSGNKTTTVPRTRYSARTTFATGASGEIDTRHVSDTCKCGSLSFIFTHPPEDLYEKNFEHV